MSRYGRRLRSEADTVLRRLAPARSSIGLLPPIETDVLAWARARHIEATAVFPAVREVRTLPHTIEPEVYERFPRRLTMQAPERYLVPLHGARLLGPRGLVALPDGRFAAESMFERVHVEAEPAYYGLRQRPVRKAGAFFSLVVSFAVADNNNYYHWMHDTLQRLYDVLPLLPPQTTFLVPPGLGPTHLDALRLLGVDPARTEVFAGDESWELETLHFAPPAVPPGQDRTEVDAWLRDTILDGLGIAHNTADRRIFISRRRANKRRLVNETEVEEYLREKGFETCQPELLTFREQVELFSRAEMVVSTHGSAFMNILFSPPGLTVVDMVQPSMLPWSPVFWSMSEAIGHRYWYFVADSVSNPGAPDDTRVPLEKLAATFDRIEAEPPDL